MKKHEKPQEQLEWEAALRAKYPHVAFYTEVRAGAERTVAYDDADASKQYGEFAPKPENNGRA